MKRGFTVVELAVVIVVMVLLATIVTIAYTSAQADARDTNRRTAVQQIVAATDTLKYQVDETLKVGGYYPSGAVPVSGLCRYNGTYAYSGSTTSNWVFYTSSSTSYRCTLGSMLVDRGLLPSDFVSKLQINSEYTTSTARQKDAAMTLYRCDYTNKKWILYYYLEKPTAADTASLTDLRNSCSLGPTVSALQNTLKMRAAVEINL